MKKIVLLILVFLPSLGYVQGLKDGEDLSPQVKRILNLESLIQSDPSSYRKEFLKIEGELKKTKDSKSLGRLYEVHSEFLSYGDFNDSLISTLHLTRKLKNDPDYALANYILLGSTFWHKSDYDSLEFWYSSSKKLISKESPHYGDFLVLEAMKFSYDGMYPKSIDNLLLAIKIFESNDRKKSLALALNNLAINYKSLDDPESYHNYLLKAAKINEEIGNTYGLIGNYNNLGISYKNQDKLDEALSFYSKAYEQIKIRNSPLLLAQNLTNRANILEKQKKYKEAEQLFLECEQISESNGIVYGVLLTNLNLGNLYRQMKVFGKSQGRLEKSLEISSKFNFPKERALTYERLSWLNRDLENYQDAYQFIQKYYSLNDSLVNESVRKEANELREKYEAEKKEIEILSLSKDKIHHQLFIALLIIGILFLLVGIQWLRFKQKRKEQTRKSEEERLKLELDLKEKELLADSVKRVSIMYTKDSIYNDLKDFIPFLPSPQSSKFASILNDLKKSGDQNMLEEFETRFLGVHEKFFSRLKELAPDLTPSEIRICALIKLNLSTKEIVSITNRTVGTIDNARSKIRKKLNLNEDENLQTFISQIC
jgi:tetratricopeptide (TPR) repeat protein